MRAKTVSLGQGPSVAKQCKDHLPVGVGRYGKECGSCGCGRKTDHIIHILDSLVLSFYWIPTVRQRWFLLAQFPHPWLAVCELAVEMQQKAHAAMQNSPRRIRNFSSRLRIGTAPASKTWTFAQTHQRKTPAKHGDNECGLAEEVAMGDDEACRTWARKTLAKFRAFPFLFP